jgi:hypothetical protein
LGLDLYDFSYRSGASVSKHFISSSFEKSVILTFECTVVKALGNFGGSPRRLGRGATQANFESGPKQPFYLFRLFDSRAVNLRGNFFTIAIYSLVEAGHFLPLTMVSCLSCALAPYYFHAHDERQLHSFLETCDGSC